MRDTSETAAVTTPQRVYGPAAATSRLMAALSASTEVSCPARNSSIGVVSAVNPSARMTYRKPEHTVIGHGSPTRPAASRTQR